LTTVPRWSSKPEPKLSYEVRLLQRGNTIARKLVTTTHFQTSTSNSGAMTPVQRRPIPTIPPIPAGCERYYSRGCDVQLGFSLTLSTKDPLCPNLVRFGGRVAGTICVLSILEDDPAFSTVNEWAASEGLTLQLEGVSYSKSDVDNAGWLRLGASVFAYPQPQNNFRTIFGESWCSTCGAGKTRRPRTLSRRPGKQQRVFSTNWIDDELFVTTDVWQRLFEPIGIASRPLFGPDGKALDTHVQLVVNTELDVKVPDDAAFEQCGVCGVTKFGFDRFRPFPAPIDETDLPIVRSRQLFGSDHGASQPILVNQEFRRQLERERFRIAFWPCS
jgi:hypothetical protein